MDWRTIPPLTALRAFSAVAEHKNVTKAGEALFVTHAAVSQQIRILENHLGIKLVVRNSRGISLTPSGEYLAKGLLSAFGEISAILRNLSEIEASRPLVISTTPMFAAGFLKPLLSDFWKQHPGIELSIESTIEAVDLNNRDVDMAIRYGTGDWSGTISELLLPGRLTVVASRSLIADRHFSHPIELLEFPILQEFASVEFDLWLEKAGVPPTMKRNVLRVPGNILLDGIRRGDGIGATVPAFISEELRTGELIALFDDPVPNIGYYMVKTASTNRTSLELLKNWLKESVEKIQITRTPQCVSWANKSGRKSQTIDYSGDIPKLTSVESENLN